MFETIGRGYEVQDRLTPESRPYRCLLCHITPKIYAKTTGQTCFMGSQNVANDGNQPSARLWMGS